MNILLIVLLSIVYLVIGAMLLILLARPEDDKLFKWSLLLVWPLVFLTYVICSVVVSFIELQIKLQNKKHNINSDEKN